MSAPNTYFTDFTARKLSNPRFRGIGSSPNNPGVTTYIDGVPQLNANSSSLELIDVDQIEFVRGPQSALFGRNTLGGLINITSTRPSLDRWSGRVTAVWQRRVRATSEARRPGRSRPNKSALVSALAIPRRATASPPTTLTGHTTWTTFGALSARLQLFGRPAGLAGPGHFAGERARDGDYALNDLAALAREAVPRLARLRRLHPPRHRRAHHCSSVTRAKRSTVTSTTGYVRWKTDDLTDLDYTPAPLITRDNLEKDVQFTQEMLASARRTRRPLAVRTAWGCKWQAGLFLFTQNYTQDAVKQLRAVPAVAVSEFSR